MKAGQIITAFHRAVKYRAMVQDKKLIFLAGGTAIRNIDAELWLIEKIDNVKKDRRSSTSDYIQSMRSWQLWVVSSRATCLCP